MGKMLTDKIYAYKMLIDTYRLYIHIKYILLHRDCYNIFSNLGMFESWWNNFFKLQKKKKKTERKRANDAWKNN